MSAAFLPVLALLCYLVAAVIVSQRLYHADGPRLKLLFSVAIAGVVMHMLGLSQSLFTAEGQNFSLLNVSSLVCWLITAAFTVTALRTPILLLLPIVYGFAAMVQLAVILLPDAVQLQHFEHSPWLLTHIIVAFIAYVILIMATLYSFQVSLISQRLKQRNPAAKWYRPSAFDAGRTTSVPADFIRHCSAGHYCVQWCSIWPRLVCPP